MKKNIAVVIPVHNEEENIPPLLNELLALEENFLIVMVNDSSSDSSGEIIEKYSATHKNIKAVHREKKEGLHAAIISGIKKALRLEVDGVVTMDGDLSHSPKDLSKMIRLAENTDLVVGSRFIKGGKTLNWSRKRKLMSYLARGISRTLLGIKTKDCSSGFKYYSKRLLFFYDFEKFVSRGYAFQIETVMRAEKGGFKVKETPITFKGRERGKSKVDPRELKSYLKSLFKLFRSKLES